MEMFFISDRSGANRMWRAVLNGGVFGTPQQVTELSALGLDLAAPTLSHDGLTLYFEAGSSVWMARRASLNDPFGNAAPVSELNVGDVQRPTRLSSDACRIYLSQDRGDAGLAGLDLYVFERQPQ